MRIAGDREICMAAGVCVMTAGATFDQDADGIVVLASDHVAAGEEKVVRNAVRMCPSGALRIVSD
jgi:ferredoxin|uniref:Ferredoxin n=1 Tax=Mycolicibacterium moriokaense TaxID=39691 RepID=A0AAD1HC16_9MYCO|nr:(4Fe-4S)-binding protein [Mycolicibacterium moriokaense]MCV7039880.1 (4Fe-4S)-binding protein [Mycolicibacterium moriokaense]ORB25722.1 ferredoxin [Mycolicibacterium moriokaense]BBX01671.1 ferredoxin [Mycolicibacterium moriokaense]